ncbi:tape measure protein [Pelagerythrobacter aerophilus]|uniref:Tape measure protein N-terminal domain-containing protein n=1 Tax=Pelagerythrobacter aerophilus TaxID=2306995 RepID=A0A418NK91_9SPHN|nr:tape measure protein [Pelagerythrobacter aerophilus]RIV79582.1 hypothetical protein D2V04_06325 [Pelagerythrobacter aerophilus]
MPTADEVIVEFEARIGKYEADLKRAQREFERSTGAQQTRMQQFERQMRASSGQIGNALKGLAATFAAAFSVREVARISDAYTRLQNNLRVAGLEGAALADVQASLLDISQRYGADLEGLTQVFLRASMAQKDLGASTSQIVQLNEIIAASLKVTGTSAEQASGALLQLGQALGSGVVRAEEFNSILEGALPLAQAAARGIDGYGGSVSKLRAAIAEGEITSRQFFEGVLRGGVQTLTDAEKATLTLSGGFTALTSALTVYIGEADKSSGASAAVGEALKTLADNLDIIIPALATIAATLGVGYVAAAARATAANIALAGSAAGAAQSMGAMGAASFALQARLAGAATTTEALAFAMRGLSGAIATLGLSAVVIGLGYLITEFESAEAAAARLRGETDALAKTNDTLAARLQEAGVKVGNLGTFADQAAGKIDGLSGSMGTAIGVATNLINTLNRLDFLETGAEIARLNRQKEFIRNPNPAAGPAEAGQALYNLLGINQRDAEVAEIDRRIDELMRGLELRTAAAKAGLDPTGAGGGTGGTAGATTKPEKGRTGPTGPTAAEIQERFASEMAAYAQQTWSAMRSTATSAEEQAELELRGVELAQKRTLESIAADADYSEAQKSLLAAQVEILAQAEREAIAFTKRAQLEQEAQELASERYQAGQEALRLEYDLARTEGERRSIALRILEAEDAYLRAKLEAVLASETATDAEQERARIALASLENTADARRRVTERAHQGPLGRYADSMADPATRVEEAVARKLESVNQGISDALSDALGTDDQFVKDLFSIFLDQVIFRPLAEALDQAGGGNLLGGLFSSVTGAIFGGGKAIGGPVRAGIPYEVGESGRELFVPQQNGVIVPNHRLTAQNGTTVISSPKFDLRGAVVTAELYADMERISRANAAQAAGKAYQQSMKDAPGRVQSAQRYGR